MDSTTKKTTFPSSKVKEEVPDESYRRGRDRNDPPAPRPTFAGYAAANIPSQQFTPPAPPSIRPSGEQHVQQRTYSTFRGRDPVETEEEKKRKKMEQDRAYRLAQERRQREKELADLERKKDRKTVMVTSFTEDSDDDDPLCKRRVIDTESGDEEYAEDSVQLDIRNQAKKVNMQKFESRKRKIFGGALPGQGQHFPKKSQMTYGSDSQVDASTSYGYVERDRKRERDANSERSSGGRRHEDNRSNTSDRRHKHTWQSSGSDASPAQDEPSGNQRAAVKAEGVSDVSSSDDDHKKKRKKHKESKKKDKKEREREKRHKKSSKKKKAKKESSDSEESSDSSGSDAPRRKKKPDIVEMLDFDEDYVKNMTPEQCKEYLLRLGNKSAKNEIKDESDEDGKDRKRDRKRKEKEREDEGERKKDNVKENWSFIGRGDFNEDLTRTFMMELMNSRKPNIEEAKRNDQVPLRERPEYFIPRKILRSRPVKWKDMAIEKIFYPPEDKKSCPSRSLFWQQIRWSKNPESYFATIDFDPRASYIPISKGRLDPEKKGWEKLRDDHEQVALPDVHAERAYMESGDRSTEVYMKEVVLDKYGVLMEKQHKLNKAIEDNPRNEKLWLQKVDLQDALFKRDCLQKMDAGENVSNSTINKEIKLAILDKARQKIPQSFDIYLLRSQLQKDSMTPEEYLELFSKKTSFFGANPKFWKAWLDTQMSDMKMYKKSRLESTFCEAFTKLDNILHNGCEVPVKFVTQAELETSLCLLVSRRLNWLIQSGEVSKAIAFMQATLANMGMPADIYEILHNNDKDHLHRIAQSLKEYWESGVPRMGDENCIPWSSYCNPQFQAKVAQFREREPEHDVETEEMKEFEKRNILAIPHDKNFSWRGWASLEKLREDYLWRPIRHQSLESEFGIEFTVFHDLSSLKLVRVTVDRVSKFTDLFIQLLGARLPFRNGSTGAVMQLFGGFPTLPHLPLRLTGFLDRLLNDLCQFAASPEIRAVYFAVRMLTKIDNLMLDASLSPRRRLIVLMKDYATVTLWSKDNLNASYIGLVLALQEAVLWVDPTAKNTKADREKVSPEFFCKTAKGVFVALEQRYGVKTLIERTDPLEFGLFGGVIMAIISAHIPHSDVISILVEVLIHGRSMEQWTMGRRESGVVAKQALEMLPILSEIQRQAPTDPLLNACGLYTPDVITNILRMRMEYACGQGADLMRIRAICVQSTTFMNTGNMADVALAYRHIIQILQMHYKQYHNCGVELNKMLSGALRDCPYDIWTLREYIEHQMTTFQKRVLCQTELREMYEHAIKEGDEKRRNLLAVARLYLARRCFENCMKTAEGRSIEGPVRQVRKEYENVARSENEPIFWRLLMKMDCERRDYIQAFQAYIQGAKTCVWSRALHLDAAYLMPQYASQVLNLMTEKELPMFALETEPDIIWEALHRGTGGTGEDEYMDTT